MDEDNADDGAGQHGGNRAWLARHYPQAPGPLIDLSTGINPYAYPLPPAQPQWQHRLADAAEVEAAQAAAAAYYGAQPARLALGAGMQPLAFALACLRLKEHGPSRVAVFPPTYSEHARVWRAVGHAVADAEDAEVVIHCNPNNPDGRTVPAQALLAQARALEARGGWLIVDESFADACPELSIAAQALPNVAVLRSCGKFFGLAGLRVSAAIGPPAWAEWLRVSAGPWPVGTAACLQLPAMFTDAAWAAGMRARLAQEAQGWRAVLARHFTVLGHTPLFTLVEAPDAKGWHAHLAAQGVLVRRFASMPGRLRFGLPAQADLPRVQAALAGGP